MSIRSVQLWTAMETPPSVPLRRESRKALLLSLVTLAVPVVGSALFPGWMVSDVGLLLWILPLAPAFLLSYYHGWRGASVALAGGMAAFALGEAVLVVAGGGVPPVEWVLGGVVVLLVVALGSGWLSERYRRSLRRAHSDALTDPGTGLPNRRAATVFLDKGFAAAQRGTGLAVVLFDLDHFKAVNDEYGHAAGDRALKEFADVLAGMTRTMNVSSRYGGEEFLSILLQSDARGAVVFADRVRQALVDTPGALPLTVSAGVAEYEEGMASPDVLVAAADQALYRAKANGRNRVETLEPMGRRVGPAPARPRDARDEIRRGAGERVLVVDDDDAARSSLARVLRRMGYSVLEAGSARRALQIVEGLDEPLDLVVTDIVMPHIRGFRMIEMLQKVHPPVRVVYVSGYSQEEVDWGGVPGSSWAFIGKPVDIQKLTGAVADLLEAPAPEPTRPESRRPSADPAEAAGASSEGLAPLLDIDRSTVPGGRILVIHPDPRTASLATIPLRRGGFQRVEHVTESPSNPDDIEADLIIADLDAGTPTLGELRRVARGGRARSTPILLLAGSRSSQRARLDLLNEGLIEVLKRPVDGLLLASTARNLLRIRWLEDERARGQERFAARMAARSAELHDSRLEILRRLARAAEYRDDLTGQHAERVGRIAGILAAELGWSVERRALIEEAAILHDVGKIAVPDALLRKPGKLTDAERQIMRQHTSLGAELLSGSRNDLLALAEEIALTHHERWDGTGYPRGLKGKEIPESGRIVAVADSYDTMIHLRPYRQPLEMTHAVDEIRNESGRQFDPAVVDAFLAARQGQELDLAVSGRLVAWPDQSG